MADYLRFMMVKKIHSRIFAPKMADINEITATYRQYLARLPKHNTRTDYSKRLDVLLSWCSMHGITRFEDVDFTTFLDYLFLDRGVSPRTRNNYRTWLRSFCSWMRVDMGDVPTMREPGKIRQPLPASLLRQIKEYLVLHDKHFLLAVMLEYYTFIRPGELSELRIGDIDVKRHAIHVRASISKNGKAEMVGLNNGIVALMRELGTLRHPKELIENAGSTLQLHSQYAKIGSKYYISLGNGTSGKNGNIFTTEDFIDFSWFAKPSIPAISENLGLEYEIAVYPWTDAWDYVSLYLAIRRSSGIGNLIVAKMHTGLKYVSNQFVEGDKEAGTMDGYKLVPCNSSRPCFFSTGNNDFLQTKGQSQIFLAYDNIAQQYPVRSYTDICYFSKNSFGKSTMGRISQCLKMIYPSIVYNDGWYYVAYQGSLPNDSQPHILLSRFKPFSATFDKVISALCKMFDTFEPTTT